ncbi:MAG: glycosyltransferase [Acidimicrobiales bacterium]
MTSEPTLAVVLCTYNGEEYLARQLESIAAQSRPPDSLVVRDDRSTDTTLQILDKFSGEASFPVLVHVNTERLGYNANFAAAMGDAEADLIAFCDQDDVWYPEKLSVLSGLLSKDTAAGAACADATCVDGDGKPLGYSVWQKLKFTSHDRRQMHTTGDVRRLLRDNVISGHCTMMRARFRDLVLPVSSHGFYDYWLALLIQSVSHFAFAETPLSDYRVHGSNAVGLPGSDLTLSGIAKRRLRMVTTANERQPTLTENRKHARSERVQFASDLLERLDAISPQAPLVEPQRTIKSWMVFCSFRATLSPNVAKRVIPVIHELRNGNYERFAKREKSLYDLLLG